MKKIFFLFVILSLFYCRETRYDEVDSVKTTVMGKITNPTTDLAIPNLKLSLKRQWKQNCGGFSTCWKEENVTEITTDSNGNYRYEFGYLPANGREYYTYTIMPTDEHYRFDKGELDNVVEASKINEKNYGIWKSITLNIHVKVSNNNIPPLYTQVTNLQDNSNFSNWSFIDQNGEKTFDFLVRPNTDVSVNFIYVENPNTINAKSHKLDYPYKTTFAETTTISYTVDCATF